MEAVFNTIIGVSEVEQGWIGANLMVDSNKASNTENNDYEGIIFRFDPGLISLSTLIKIHLASHSASNQHQLRARYPSAIYTFNQKQQQQAEKILAQLKRQQQHSGQKVIMTQALTFARFTASPSAQQNYYYQDISKPFLQNQNHAKACPTA